MVISPHHHAYFLSLVFFSFSCWVFSQSFLIEKLRVRREKKEEEIRINKARKFNYKAETRKAEEKGYTKENRRPPSERGGLRTMASRRAAALGARCGWASRPLASARRLETTPTPMPLVSFWFLGSEKKGRPSIVGGVVESAVGLSFHFSSPL